MFVIASISPGDLAIVFVLALVIFGPKRLPEVARQIGGALRDLRKLSSEFTGAFLGMHDDVRSVVAPVASAAVSSVMAPSEASNGSRPLDQSVPPASAERTNPPQVGSATDDSNLMAPKLEFGDAPVSPRSSRGVTLSTLAAETQTAMDEEPVSARSRRGVTLSTLPPAGEGES